MPEVTPAKAVKQAQESGYTVVGDVQNLPLVKEGYTRLYHGTFSENLQSIKEQGLIMSGEGRPVLATINPQLVEGGSVYGDVQVVFDVPTTARVTQESGMGSGIVQFNKVSPEQIVGVFIEGKPKPPAVEPIEHRGTEPAGIAIADELGLRYDGIQEGIEELPSKMMFTDIYQTRSTFGANTLEKATERLSEMREAFAKHPAMSVVEYDRRYTLEELREMARQAGLSPSGSKKEIASRLIARGVT